MPNASAKLGSQVRSTTKWIHTWSGLIFGLVVSVICLSGSIIVFRQEVESPPKLGAGAVDSRNISLDASAREIGRLRPGVRVTRVRFPWNRNEPYVFQVRAEDKQTRRIVFDASSGQVVGEQANAAWLTWMIDLHRNVLAAKPGRKVVGVIGIISFLFAATGLLLWLINGANLRALVTVRTGSPRRFNLELHRAAGLWALAFVVLVSLTGVALSYPQTFRDAWESATGTPAAVRAPKATKIPVQQVRSLDEYLAIGQKSMADGVPRELRVPESPTGLVSVRFWRAGDLTEAGSNRVYIDAASGTVLSTDRASDWPLGVRLFQAMAPIHYGEWGGLPIKIVWSILGVVPTVLFITGVLVWWRPRKKKQRFRVYGDFQDREISCEAPITEPVGQ